MNEAVVIDAQIDKKDIRHLTAAQAGYFFANKSLLIVSAFFVVFVLYMTGFRFSVSTLHFLPLPLLVLSVIYLIFLAAIIRGSRQSFVRNKMYLTKTHFEFSEAGIAVTSKYGSTSVPWDRIASIKEFRPAFIISLSGTDEYVINRKSFTDQAHLDNFLALLAAHIDAGKLILKHYSLPVSDRSNAGSSGSSGGASVHSAAAAAHSGEAAAHSAEAALHSAEAELHSDAESPVEPDAVEVNFSLSRKEAFLFEIERCYRQAFGKIMTLIGILLIAVFVFDRIRNVNFLYSDIIILAAGCFSILIMPFSAWIKVNQNFKSSGNKPRVQVFRFDENYLCTDRGGTDERKYRWNEILTFDEHKDGFTFSAKSAADYQNRSRIISKVTRKDYFVPKSAFQTAGDLIRFKEILNKTRKFIVK